MMMIMMDPIRSKLFTCLTILLLWQAAILPCMSPDDSSLSSLNNNNINDHHENEDILDNNNNDDDNNNNNNRSSNGNNIYIPLNLLKNSNLSSFQQQPQPQPQPQPSQPQQQILGLQSNISTGGNGNKDEAQNQFQSSISCGHLEFYVQLTFNKPFKGLVYAYKMYQSELSARYDHYYPLEILDSCTIRGNGASIVYLELSFLSECVEKLPSSFQGPSSTSSPSPAAAPPPPPSSSTPLSAAKSAEIGGLNTNNEKSEKSVQRDQAELMADGILDSNSTNDPITATYGFVNSHTFNLDGFNFRRALNDHQPLDLNISQDETYQLSLYIQHNPKIEQKFDSKVLVQCQPKVTKNIILEQISKSKENFYRKIDQPPPLNRTHNDDSIRYNSPQPKSILPKTNLTVTSFNTEDNEIDVTQLIESRMDLLRGRIPFLKVIEGNVELGDDLTLIIRTRQIDDYDSKISNCFAYDERDSMRFQLTNQEGCPADSSVMPAFKVLHNVGPESKVYYTTFAAFKFPGSQYLNIQCTMLVCQQTCPKPICDPPKQPYHK